MDTIPEAASPPHDPHAPAYSSPGFPERWFRRPSSIVAQLTLIVFLVELGLTLNGVPFVSVVTALVCSQHHGYAPPEELTQRFCAKDASVMAETNRLLMINTVIGSLLTLPLALIFPAAADIYGRKWIFGFCIFGILVNNGWAIIMAHLFPKVSVDSILVANMALLLGGGFRVGEALVFTMISDVSNDRWRTTWFQVAICGFLLGEVIGALFGGFLLAKSLWLPLYIGLGFIGTGLAMAMVLPETLRMRPREQNVRSTSGQPRPRGFVTKAKKVWRSVKDTFCSLSHRGVFLLVPAASLVIPISSSALFLMIQALPVRYQSDFTGSSRYQAISALTTLVVFILILPLLSFLLRGKPVIDRDRILNNGSSIFLIVGMLLIATAPSLAAAIVSLVIFTLGAGVPGLCRSMIAQVTEKGNVGTLFGFLAVVEQLGFLVFSLSMTALFQKSIEDGGGYALAYPFYFAFAVVSLACSYSWFAHPRAPMRQNEEAIEMEIPRDRQHGTE
ncbi:major facilitator superfamily domain-containing protein [Biscogniauxia sp. FL1348]|nr:major facilitator superfamily domain-containing protein [Biscogniauxia sp. FL1348]